MALIWLLLVSLIITGTEFYFVTDNDVKQPLICAAEIDKRVSNRSRIVSEKITQKLCNEV